MLLLLRVMQAGRQIIRRSTVDTDPVHVCAATNGVPGAPARAHHAIAHILGL